MVARALHDTYRPPMGLLKTLLVEEHEQTQVGAREFVVRCPRCGRSSKGSMRAAAKGRASSWRWGNADAALDSARAEAAQEVADETLALISLVRCPGCLQRMPSAHLRLGLSLLVESLWFGTLCAVAAGIVIKIAVEENARYWAQTHPWFGFKLFIALGVFTWWAVKMIRRPRKADASVQWLSDNTSVTPKG